MNIQATPITSDPNKDYRINSNKVTLADGQGTAAVPISIINDHDPEFKETFIVRVMSSDANVVVSSPSQCEVTIEENDYPYGLIGNILVTIHRQRGDVGHFSVAQHFFSQRNR